jgi:hypothetical protein
VQSVDLGQDRRRVLAVVGETLHHGAEKSLRETNRHIEGFFHRKLAGLLGSLDNVPASLEKVNAHDRGLRRTTLWAAAKKRNCNMLRAGTRVWWRRSVPGQPIEIVRGEREILRWAKFALRTFSDSGQNLRVTSVHILHVRDQFVMAILAVLRDRFDIGLGSLYVGLCSLDIELNGLEKNAGIALRLLYKRLGTSMELANQCSGRAPIKEHAIDGEREPKQ